MKVSDLAMLAHKEDPRKRVDEVLAKKTAPRPSPGIVFPNSWSPEMIQRYIMMHHHARGVLPEANFAYTVNTST